MYHIPEKVIELVKQQGFVLVSTIDAQGHIHCSAKSIASITADGTLCLVDLYNGHTVANLKENPTISVTAIDEHAFIGYSLRGRARLVECGSIKPNILKQWQGRIVSRISQRVIRDIQKEHSSITHPESRFPQPKCLIEIEVQDIIDLAPAYLRRSL